jgi:Kef-type K+ transport system membrane component KefB/nucleotide-binding universal stress UspA family protein
MSARPTRRWVPIAAYASIFLILAIGLVLVLPAGNQLIPAPQAPAVGAVTGGAEVCLGGRVAFVQSGVFLDIHVSGQDGHIGQKLVGGRVVRETGNARLVGVCSDLSEFAGSATVVTGRVIEGVGLEGELVIGPDRFQVHISGADAEADGGSADQELSRGELLSRILLAVAVVIIAARLLGSVFQRIGQPRVIGEITAGILLGPSLLGLLFPEVTEFLFPSAVTEVLAILAQFGLIFFMFLIGVELDHRQIRGSGHTAVLISHYSIVIPLVFGIGAALLVFPLVGSGDFTGFALFMGAAMAITAFPVLARILTDTGLYKTRLGALAITCAAVDDVTAWCVLAIVVAIVKASGPMDAVVTVVLSLAFVVFMLAVVRPVAARVVAPRKGRGPLNATVMSFLIAGLFLSALATELIGIHAIFGAFMFGAVMPRQRGVATRIIERLEDVTVLFLLPVFFAVVGLSTQIGLVSGWDLWLLTALIITIAVIGKVGGSVVAGLAAGESLRSSTVIGVLMNARGITEIVILTIGIELGVISPALFTIMVLMALTTTLMTTPLLTRIYPRSMVERDIMVEQHLDAARRDFGSRRVMVGVTDPVTARPLVQVAGWLRGADGESATVVLASVIAPPGHEQVRAKIDDFVETSAAAAANLSVVADELDRQGVRSEVVTRIGTDRGEELRLLCEQQDVDLVVIGSHEAYLSNRPLGGLVGELLRTAPADVVVVVNGDSRLALDVGPVGVWLGGAATDIATFNLAMSIARGLDRDVWAVASGSLPPGIEVGQLIEVSPDAPAREVLRAFDAAALLVVGAPRSERQLDSDLVEEMTRRQGPPVLVLRPAPDAVGNTVSERTAAAGSLESSS